jgi:DNA-binding transcriptional MerR regulator
MKLLSLPEFAAVAANAVKASGAVPENRQAKPIPAERMIRYYTARGLLPRPGTRGRALTYGRTHLIHLVAVKRLQGQGLSLDEIALQLNGMSQAELESLAAIPASAMPADLGDPEPAAAPSRAAGRFWQTAPQLASAPQRASASPPASTSPAAEPPAELRAVRLSDTVTLLFDGPAHQLPPADTLRRAAAPLLELLANHERTHDEH